VFTGRPLRVLKTPYLVNWENERFSEIRELTSKGKIPVNYDIEKYSKEAESGNSNIDASVFRPYLMGQAAGAIEDVKPAAQIITEMVTQAVSIISSNSKKIVKARL